MEIAFYIEEYAKFSKTEKKLARIIFDHEIKVKKGKYDRVRLKRKTLADYVDCCTKTVTRFNNKVKYFLIGVKEKWKSNGDQGANEYIIDPGLFAAMRLIYDNKLLYKTKAELLKFAQSHREKENVSLYPQKCPSSYSSSSDLNAKEYRRVHPYLEKIEGLTHQERMSLSLNGESIIINAIEDYEWFKSKKKIDTPYGLMIMLMNKWKGKSRETNGMGLKI